MNDTLTAIIVTVAIQLYAKEESMGIQIIVVVTRKLEDGGNRKQFVLVNVHGANMKTIADIDGAGTWFKEMEE